MSNPLGPISVQAPTMTEIVTKEDKLTDVLTVSMSRSTSLTVDAWRDLRRNPLFWLASIAVMVLLIMVFFPGWFTSKDPTWCELINSRKTPHPGSLFGNDQQGCDIYARTIYGARTSISVGILAALMTLAIGLVFGILGGYFGGWFDALLSRITDVFFGIPFLLGAIIIMVAFPTTETTTRLGATLTVVAAMAVLGWTATARLVRASVIGIKQAEFVQAAQALGASTPRIILRHILPNALTSAIVVTTLSVGGFIAAEATLSYLGLGFRSDVPSWGQSLAAAQSYVESTPHLLIFPGLFLAVTVLAFIVLGDAVRDAFDPKLR